MTTTYDLREQVITVGTAKFRVLSEGDASIEFLGFAPPEGEPIRQTAAGRRWPRYGEKRLSHSEPKYGRRRWSIHDEGDLIRMYKAGFTLAEMERAMFRSKEAIGMRLSAMRREGRIQ